MFTHDKKIICMAPMAEVTTPALRKCVRSFSPDTVLFSEMLSASGLAGNAQHNEPLMARNESDEPFVYQLLGGDPETMSRACIILQDMGASAIDINMGCSAPDIVKRMQGARLLQDPSLAGAIIKECRKVFRGKLSVKMRSGYESGSGEFVTDFARMLEDEGVDFITLHGRYARLSFRRKADWSLVKLLKGKISIPLIGNGDVSSPEEAQLRLKETGCNGIMIGREGVKAPWIFALTENLINTGTYSLTVDLLDIFTGVMKDLENNLPLHLHKSRGHRFCFYYTKNFVFYHDIFKKIRNVDRIKDMMDILEEYLYRNPHERVKVFQKE